MNAKLVGKFRSCSTHANCSGYRSSGHVLMKRRLTCKRDIRLHSGPDHSDSDTVFVLKLVAWSFVGGAMIKYGSLLFPVAFSPDPAIATLCVASPPILYAIATLLSQKKSGSSSSST
ncbi:hypothetical protein CEUSTIGMA_g1639.t1 [Chlamydomonas eustigma]|uniref:Uncharacterized protein n=1 Tax=Chlamydomonas eustigma TaxID=1157962 RepID=A0A250WUF2_9CHLO|nr:hypothetical protein CEUSTIGMA_g1639.t1 [Chlamydomonas eustigma]|eukprot:GAX74190.1 hypothetical protein CEUSTIGMA_g1639.t1 [Chlamydomonas eustigma]